MSLDESVRCVLERLTQKLAAAQAEVRRLKRSINDMLEAADEAPQFDLAAEEDAPSATQASRRRQYRRDEFFGQPLAGVVRQLIEDNGALNEDELYRLMLSGGYVFAEKDESKAKTNLKISLGKNQAFGRTQAGYYTLSKKIAKSTRRQDSGPSGQPLARDNDSDQDSENGPQESDSMV